MAVETPPWSLQGVSHPATTARHIAQALTASPFGTFAGGVSPVTGGGGHGVVNTTDLAVTQNGTPNMSVNVAGGLALIRGTEAAAQGVYSFYNDAAVNLAISAADPTNPRRDLIIAQIQDSNYSGASLTARLVVVTGTAAASPVDPSLTAYPDALVLARVAVAAAATSITNANITDLRTFATATGGQARFTSTTRWTNASTGQTALELDTGRQMIFNGTTWRYVSPITGTYTLTFSANTTATVAVTFPVTFTVAPIVMLNGIAFTANTPIAVNLTGSASTTGFTVIGRNVAANASGTIALTGTASGQWAAWEPYT